MAKMKVLLVDDEEEFVRTLAERMEMRDVGPDVALNGEEALERVEEDTPDVMVLDLRMPGLDGLEVLEKVKKAYPKIQVIILTGHGSDQDEETALRLGAYDYLRKPADLDHLLKTIKSAYKSIQQTMTAAAFAEAGDYETAEEIEHQLKGKGKK
jgi:DNA-binding response OmpR family regulator